MDTKICIGCRQEKDSSCFNHNKKMKDGFHSYCKECRRKQARDYYQENKGYIRKKTKEYLSTPGGKAMRAKSSHNWYLKHTEIVKNNNEKVCNRYSEYRCTALRKDRVFELTLEQFIEITRQKCFFCGDFSAGKDFCGVDRTDSSLGYTLTNCVPCCKECNMSKQARSNQKFLDHCKRVALHSKLLDSH